MKPHAIIFLLCSSAIAQAPDWGRYATQSVPPPVVITAPQIPYIAPTQVFSQPITQVGAMWRKDIAATYKAIPDSQKMQWLNREPPSPTIRGKL